MLLQQLPLHKPVQHQCTARGSPLQAPTSGLPLSSCSQRRLRNVVGDTWVLEIFPNHFSNVAFCGNCVFNLAVFELCWNKSCQFSPEPCPVGEARHAAFLSKIPLKTEFYNQSCQSQSGDKQTPGEPLLALLNLYFLGKTAHSIRKPMVSTVLLHLLPRVLVSSVIHFL